ncbi:MAG TPA: deoxyribose-phosphate aldolase [Candidatus Atribacteria bacterium]|nr:deoxyribose-phosphate aldolase [Candidatus Atribacteria bacterium]
MNPDKMNKKEIDKNSNETMSESEKVPSFKNSLFKSDLVNRNFPRSAEGCDIQIKTPADLAPYIDHTLLKPDATEAQIRKLCEEAIQYGFCSVCVNPVRVEYCAKKLMGTGIKVCAVIGFPLGATDSKTKAYETQDVIKNGASEIDMVINIGALKDRDLKTLEEDLRAVLRACRSTTTTKAIIETCLLTDEEKVIASQLVKKVGYDFVKTSTGFSTAGATAHDVALIRRTVGPKMGIKAAGGIRTFEDALLMIKTGATRLGCSASVKIVSV